MEYISFSIKYYKQKKVLIINLIDKFNKPI